MCVRASAGRGLGKFSGGEGGYNGIDIQACERKHRDEIRKHRFFSDGKRGSGDRCMQNAEASFGLCNSPHLAHYLIV